MLCCFDGWWRVLCYLDHFNHAILRGFHVRWICDLHDDRIMRGYPDDQAIA